MCCTSKFQHVIHDNTRFFHRVSLRDRARETVQQKTVTAVFLGDTLFNQRKSPVHRHQFTGVHDIFACLPNSEPDFTRRAAYRQWRFAGIPYFHDELSLSSFTRARSAKQNNTHYENLKGCRYFLKSAKRYHHHALKKPPDAETVNEEKSRKEKAL